MGPGRTRLLRALLPVIASSASSASCLSTLEVEIPSEPGAKAIVLGVVPKSGDSNSIRLYASEAGGFRGIPLALEQGATLVALYYARSLDELVLQPGELQRADPNDLFRSLPRSETAQKAQIRDGGPRFEIDPEAGTLLAGFHLPALGSTCAKNGGCLIDSADDFCTLPCPPASAPPLPMLPDQPAPPSLLPCPEGWRELPDAASGVIGCGPTESPIERDCGGLGTAQFFGDSECTPIGPPCPTGEWATGLPAGRTILYVRSGAPPGGAGTTVRPFGTIAEAIARAGDGAIIALGQGTFDEAVTLRSAVTLWGACVDRTEIRTSSASASAPAISVRGLGVGLKNLRVTGGDIAVKVGPDFASALGEQLLVSGPGGIGVQVEGGGRWSGSRLVIRGRTSAGFEVLSGGQAEEVSELVVERTAGNAVRAAGNGTQLSLARAVLHESRDPMTVGDGALTVKRGARLELKSARLAKNQSAGIRVQDPGTVASIRDVTVEETNSAGVDGADGYGIDVAAGARLDAERIALLGSHRAALEIRGPGTGARLARLLVEGTLPEEATAALGAGIEIDTGAGLELDRALIRQNVHSGIFLHGLGTTATITQVAIGETARSVRDFAGARGIGVAQSAKLSATGLAIGGVSGEGIYVWENGDAKLTDVRVKGPETLPMVATGATNLVSQISTIRVTRGLFEDAIGLGVSLSETKAQLFDLTVRRTRKNLADPANESGLGLFAFHVNLGLSKALVEDCAATAVEISGLTTNTKINDLTIRGRGDTGGPGLHVANARTASISGVLTEDTKSYGVFLERDVLVVPPLEGNGSVRISGATLRHNHFGDPRCTEACQDAALRALGGVTVRVSDFSITQNAYSGVRIEPGVTLFLTRGEIAGHRVGVALLTKGYDEKRLLRQVVFRENDWALRVISGE